MEVGHTRTQDEGAGGLPSKDHVAVCSAESSEDSSQNRSGCADCTRLASIRRLSASNYAMAGNGAIVARDADSELQSCPSNASSTHSRRMQQVGDRVFLEELVAQLGATLSSIKPKKHIRHIDLEELSMLKERSPSSQEPPSRRQLRDDGVAQRLQPLAIKIPDLVIGTVVAVGSAGRIYYGTYSGQEVAVKIFKQTATCSGHPTFQQEVSLLSQLRHPNIVKFLGAYDHPPLQLHVTEYLPEGSLRAFLERVPANEPVRYLERLRMARDIACGLGYLHSLGILHRDCKSENMVIASDGTVKLTDFGIARMEGEPSDMTSETGTYRYMAPEVIGHRPYNRSADVYSFGLVLWETLTGELPFAGLNAVQAAFAVVHKHRRPVIPPECPGPVKSLIQACWHANPSKRPDFASILATLDSAIEELEAPGSSACPKGRTASCGCWTLPFVRKAR